jgi:hypothetical protein
MFSFFKFSRKWVLWMMWFCKWSIHMHTESLFTHQDGKLINNLKPSITGTIISVHWIYKGPTVFSHFHDVMLTVLSSPFSVHRKYKTTLYMTRLTYQTRYQNLLAYSYTTVFLSQSPVIQNPFIAKFLQYLPPQPSTSRNGISFRNRSFYTSA